MNPINNNILNNSNDYSIFLLIKKNMINGEISINDLSSRNRALLHRICADFGLEHYSTGSYNNRVFVIKDSQHTYFTQTQNDNYWENYLNNLDNDQSQNNNNQDQKQNYKNKDEDDDEEDYEEDDEDDEEDEEDYEDDEEEIDTDTYSSSSDSSNNSDSNSSSSISTSEYNLYLINKLNNQNMMLKYIYILSLGNLIVNTYLMFTI